MLMKGLVIDFTDSSLSVMAEKLNSLKDQLRGLEAGLVEALSSKHFFSLVQISTNGMYVTLNMLLCCDEWFSL